MRTVILSIWMVALHACLLQAVAADKAIPAPDEKTFFVDNAGLLSKTDAGRIEQAGKKLLADTGVHLVVLTVKSMAEYNKATNPEAFVKVFLDAWIKTQTDKSWTKAAVLLRAADDRKVHIQLGGAWHHTQDKACADIMMNTMAPKFMTGDVSGGLADGADALCKLLTKNIDAANAEAGPKKNAAPIGGGETGGADPSNGDWIIGLIFFAALMSFFAFCFFFVARIVYRGIVGIRRHGWRSSSCDDNAAYNTSSSSTDSSWSSSSSSNSDSSSSSSSGSDGGGATGNF